MRKKVFLFLVLNVVISVLLVSQELLFGGLVASISFSTLLVDSSLPQETFTCSKLTKETPENGMKYIQS